jgi:SAM-dependent methyltransferase
MDWRIKGLAQKALGVVPGGVRINDLLQRRLGGLRNFRRHVTSKVLDDWVVLASYMNELGIPLAGLRFVEIGSGWFPTLPICFSLAGARDIVTFDLTRHLYAGLSFKMVALLDSLLPAIAEAGGRPLAEVKAHYLELTRARTLEQLLQRARIDYRAPADASSSGLAGQSADVVFSNSVLEHVPRPDIARMMEETRRVLRPGGLAIHCANCGDHYAYFDHTITPINYLTYSDREWAFWNNRLLYQNRLRPVDFVRLAEEARLEVVLLKSRPRAELLAVLPRMNIASLFSHYPAEELCSTSIGLVARNP